MSALENAIDERLLIEAAQQDPSRFAELYEKYVDRVYAYVAYRVRNRDEAQDLTAEVFHHALANLGRFEWRGVPFVTWLFRIAANAMATRWQQAGREQELPPQIADELAVEAEVESHAIFRNLVDSLPPDQRHVIIRRFVDQRSVREIAREMGRTEGAIRQLQFRALQSLRDLLRSHHV